MCFVFSKKKWQKMILDGFPLLVLTGFKHFTGEIGIFPRGGLSKRKILFGISAKGCSIPLRLPSCVFFRMVFEG